MKFNRLVWDQTFPKNPFAQALSPRCRVDDSRPMLLRIRRLPKMSPLKFMFCDRFETSMINAFKRISLDMYLICIIRL